MFTEDKVIEILYMTKDFRKFFTAMMQTYTLPTPLVGEVYNAILHGSWDRTVQNDRTKK